MKTLKTLLYSIALAGTLAVPMVSNAAMIAYICDDFSCTGANDTIVADNGVGDASATAGLIIASTSAYGYTVLVNTSQSKPLIGSAAAPELDITYSVTGNAGTGVTGSVFLWLFDDGFTGPGGSFTLANGGTTSGGETISARAYLAPAQQFLSLSGFGSTTGPLATLSSPYGLYLLVEVNRANAGRGTTTGDANLKVPEPSTVLLGGVALLALGMASRRRRNG